MLPLHVLLCQFSYIHRVLSRIQNFFKHFKTRNENHPAPTCTIVELHSRF